MTDTSFSLSKFKPAKRQERSKKQITAFNKNMVIKKQALLQQFNQTKDWK
ncbi:hypothetical protein [Photobacterium profundum]|nr:hypothetical protein [Photobacterium profundum]